MDEHLKITAAVIIVLFLYLVLSKYGKDFSVVITILACVMVMIGTTTFLEPVLSFIRKLMQLGNIDSDMLGILFKAVGIGLLTEVTAIICTDAGNASLSKCLQILGSFVILWLAIPLFTTLLNVVEEILFTL